MTAVVAPHHADIWHRSDQSIHIANMNLSGLVSSYDSSSRTVTHPSTSRGYQATTSHMDINMPLFSTHPMPTSMPYQSGAFAFDQLSVNPYSMQQPFSVSYPQTIPHAVSYPATPSIQQVPAVRDPPSGFALERTPPVKSESSSPVQSSPMYSETAYNSDFKRSESEPADANNTTFATDVDTLKKAIQAKQKPVQHHPPSPNVRTASPSYLQWQKSHFQRRKKSPKPSRSQRRDIHAACRIATRAFYRRLTWRSTREPILASNLL